MEGDSENGTATAEFFNRTQPQRIINFSVPVPQRPRCIRKRRPKPSSPATELENLQEERLLLELLNTDGPLTYDGFHDRIEFRVRGTLPDDKMKMLNRLDLAIEGYRSMCLSLQPQMIRPEIPFKNTKNNLAFI